MITKKFKKMKIKIITNRKFLNIIVMHYYYYYLLGRYYACITTFEKSIHIITQKQIRTWSKVCVNSTNLRKKLLIAAGVVIKTETPMKKRKHLNEHII